ncbi:MAG TPA: FliM/FliN family flagellar motor switch protein [Polyangiaceae bacterium]|nr:FliM/FliN family flagellar motor switch protein [Polyangiaceae bacterium]
MSAVQPFPWDRVPRLERAAVEARRELARRVVSSLDPERLCAALTQLLGADAELSGVDVAEERSGESPVPSMYDAHTLQFPALGWRVTLWPEPELARACVARLLGQDFELGWADTGIDAALRGAGAALALEVARRAARAEAPELVNETAPAAAWSSVGHVTVRLGGKPYRLELRAETLRLGRPVPATPPPVTLWRLGDVPIVLPWLSALSLATVAEVEGLAVGDVWVPGARAWLGGEVLTAGVLCAPGAGRGWPVRVSGGKIVLGAEAVRVHEELNVVSQEESELTQVVGEAPVFVRLELGSLELSAAEWAALRPGDVVQCGRRIDEPVVLRAGGREIARGELVDIEGEIGVRITRVGSAAAVR